MPLTLGYGYRPDSRVGHVMSMLTNNRKQRWLLPVVLGSIMLLVVLGALLD
ncbi:hypothetical protein GCM10007147_45860 [Nocardiopsis kunsanensis]|uniref:Uncharacterized protein n=1 Tax=Nocardiopsis kunsanensis TaxID=141693 RepID=A0A918XLF9_9ACTN|nr:hypothetical protein GCM10007147_45860 [Nocardiopsis kunsanensis]